MAPQRILTDDTVTLHVVLDRPVWEAIPEPRSVAVRELLEEGFTGWRIARIGQTGVLIKRGALMELINAAIDLAPAAHVHVRAIRTPAPEHTDLPIWGAEAQALWDNYTNSKGTNHT